MSALKCGSIFSVATVKRGWGNIFYLRLDFPFCATTLFRSAVCASVKIKENRLSPQSERKIHSRRSVGFQQLLRSAFCTFLCLVMEINGTVDNQKIFNFDDLGKAWMTMLLWKDSKVCSLVQIWRCSSSWQKLLKLESSLTVSCWRRNYFCGLTHDVLPKQGPYSNFAVGAALLTTTGEVFTGKCT